MASIGGLSVRIGADIGDLLKGLNRAQRSFNQAGQSMIDTAENLRKKTSASFSLLGQNITVSADEAFGALSALSLKAFGDFEASINRVGVLSGATGEELDQLTAIAKELGATTAFSAKEASDGLQFLAQAGFSAQEQIQALPSVLDLASAGATDLATASDIASDLLTAFGKDASELGQVNDVLAGTFTKTNTNLQGLFNGLKQVAPLATSAGIGITDLNASIGILANQGIKGEQSGTAIRNIIQSLLKPSKEAKAELEKLGVTVNAQTLAQKGLTGTFKELGDAGLNTTQAFKIFGSFGAATATVLANSADETIKLREELQKAGGTASRVASASLQGLNGAIKSLQSAFEGLLITVGETLAPIAQSVINFATNAIRAIAGLDEGFIKFGLAVSAIVAGLPALIGLIGVLTTAFGALLSPVTLVITALVGASALIITNWQRVVDFFNNNETATGFLENFKRAFNQLATIVVTVVNAIIELFAFMYTQLASVSGQGLTAIADIFQRAFGTILSTFDFFINIITGEWRKALVNLVQITLDIFVNPIQRILSGLLAVGDRLGIDTSKIQELSAFIDEASQSAVDFTKNLLGVTDESATTINALGELESIVGNIKLAFQSASNPIKETTTAIKEQNEEINKALNNIDFWVNQILSDEIEEDGEQVIETFNRMNITLEDLQNSAIQASRAIGQVLGEALKGGEVSAKDFLKAILPVVAQLAGLAIGGPAGAILGAGLGGIVSGAFATGGGVIRQPSFAQVAEAGQGEAFIPLNRTPDFMPNQQEVTVVIDGRIRGDDLRFGNKLAQSSKKNRTYGG